MSRTRRARAKTNLVDVVARRIHLRWLQRLRAQGVKSRLSTWGEELMVSWSRLSARGKNYNRQMVRDVFAELAEDV